MQYTSVVEILYYRLTFAKKVFTLKQILLQLTELRLFLERYFMHVSMWKSSFHNRSSIRKRRLPHTHKDFLWMWSFERPLAGRWTGMVKNIPSHHHCCAYTHEYAVVMMDIWNECRIENSSWTIRLKWFIFARVSTCAEQYNCSYLCIGR